MRSSQRALNPLEPSCCVQSRIGALRANDQRRDDDALVRNERTVIGFPLGLLYSNGVEWAVHKYLLHGLGKRRGSFWAFHWVRHHRQSRRHQMLDPDYQNLRHNWAGHSKEVGGIALILLVHTPLVTTFPWFTAAVWYSGLNYLHKHRKAHLNPAWAKRHMRSHYDHHMGRNQDANWCVTRPWFDWIMGTREFMNDEPSPRRKVAPEPALLAGPIAA